MNIDSNVCCCGLLLLAVVLGVPYLLGGSSGRWMSREEAEARLVEIEKEMGLRPYTREELLAMEEEERQTYNNAVRTIAFWAGSGSRYVDYDGMLRDGWTDEPIQWVGNSATGKTRKK